MSMTLATLYTPTTSLKPPNRPLKLSPQTHLFNRTLSHASLFSSLTIRTRSLKCEQANNYPVTKYGFRFCGTRNIGFALKAENTEGEEKTSVDKAEEEARGQSTMPERFRYLTKEAPDRPVRWPWFIALVFLIYAWRTVLWELSNWKKAAVWIVHLFAYPLKLALALIFHFIGDPITSIVKSIETALYTIRASYSNIIANAPILELTVIIMLASAVLAVAEATVPDSVSSQQYILTVAGIVGFAAVRNYITELAFWLLLMGLFAFARFVKKRDYVSSSLPVAAVLVAIGEPWVRVIVMISYIALAIIHHSKKAAEGNGEGFPMDRKVPFPLLCSALAIGVRIAAKWAGYRHLTWMVV